MFNGSVASGMKPRIYCLATILALYPLLWESATLAQPAPIRFTPSQLQQLSGGLYQFNSQEFFAQGQRRLEEEIKLLDRRDQFLKEGVLKISQDLQVKPDFSPYERPELKLPQQTR